MDTPELLDKAADYIDTHGWNQGGYENYETGEVCAAGAICKAFESSYAVTTNLDEELVQSAFEAVDNQLEGFSKLPYPLKHQNIASYNDTPGRTQGEVTDLLRTTAKKLRG